MRTKVIGGLACFGFAPESAERIDFERDAFETELRARISARVLAGEIERVLGVARAPLGVGLVQE